MVKIDFKQSYFTQEPLKNNNDDLADLRIGTLRRA